MAKEHKVLRGIIDHVNRNMTAVAKEEQDYLSDEEKAYDEYDQILDEAGLDALSSVLPPASDILRQYNLPMYRLGFLGFCKKAGYDISLPNDK